MEYTSDQKALIMLSFTEGYNARKRRFDSVDRPCELYDDYSVADKMIAKMESRNIGVITILDDDYPQRLKEIYDPPYTLYYQGDKSLLNDKDTVAVVGTRKVSAYGKNVMSNFLPAFIKSGLTVVSGLARGVDSIGHKACIEQGARTIAVVANGLDICYPPENLNLQQQIVDKGLIISEYPMGTKPLQYHFPERNRIISALAHAVFIPEAGDRSGSLITADYAIEQGKELFVVPGSIFSQQSVGCNKKIKELQATIAITPDDVIFAFGRNAVKEDKIAIQLDMDSQSIVDLLQEGAKHFDEIFDATAINIGQLSGILTQLEICGVIRKTQGNYYEIIPQL